MLKKARTDPLKQPQSFLVTGDYQKTIDAHKSMHAKSPGDKTILNNYLENIEDIKVIADKAYSRKDFAFAINTYNILSKNFSDFKEFKQFLSFDNASLNIMIQKCDIHITHGLVRSHIVNKQFQSALDAFKDAQLEYLEDRTLSHSYIKAVKRLKNMADRAFKKKDFTSSGVIYHILLKNYAQFYEFERFLLFDSILLNARITDCSTFLTKKGIEQYRMGNFFRAISIWESILIFDSDNVEVRKAVDTASIQLKNLQQKK